MVHTDRPSGPVAREGIELLTFSTPNGFKIAILLEELKEAYGKQYTYQSIDIFQKVQKEPWFTKLSPNGYIPVVIDHDKGEGGYVVMEGLAILNYLSRHYDPEHKFSFRDPLDICTAEQWMAWQHGGIGPAQAQAIFFYRFSQERYAYPTQRFVGETERLYGVMNTRLANRDYLAGSGRGKYSTADIALWPFIDTCAAAGVDLEKFPNVYEWWSRISERPAVQKGMMVPSGQEFPLGYKVVQKKKKEDPLETEKTEGPLREALKKAQKEFGYKYKSP